MRNTGTYLRVGLLLVACVIAGVALVLFLGRNRVRDGLRMESYFSESVQGLAVGAAVTYRGVTLGQVTEIGLVAAAYGVAKRLDFNAEAGRQVFVRYIVAPARMGETPDVDELIRLGLRARLASQGITGLAYIELDFVNPARFPVEHVPWAPVYPIVPSIPSTITQVQDAAQTILNRLQDIDLKALAGSVQTLIDGLNEDLTKGDVHATLTEASALLRSLRGAVADANLPALTADLKSTSTAVRGLADGKQTRELMASATRAADRLAEAANKLPPLIAALDATVRRVNAGTSDIQADLVPVLRDARAAVANLRETSEALRRYPAGTIFGGPPPRDQGR